MKLNLFAIAITSALVIATIPTPVSAQGVKNVNKLKTCTSYNAAHGGKEIAEGYLKGSEGGNVFRTSTKYRIWKKGDMRCAVVWDVQDNKWNTMVIVRNYQYASGDCYATAFKRSVRAENVKSVAMEYKDISGTSERDYMLFRTYKNSTVGTATWLERKC